MKQITNLGEKLGAQNKNSKKRKLVLKAFPPPLFLPTLFFFFVKIGGP